MACQDHFQLSGQTHSITHRLKYCQIIHIKLDALVFINKIIFELPIIKRASAEPERYIIQQFNTVSNLSSNFLISHYAKYCSKLMAFNM